MEQDKKHTSNITLIQKIQLLQDQVDQMQLKIFEEKNKRWYKTPSIIISAIALASSLFFSWKSVVDSTQSKEEEEKSSVIMTIKKSINDLTIEEEKLNTIISNQFIDLNAKNRASQTYNAKAASLIDQISKSKKLLKTDLVTEIEPNLLINYGRFLLLNWKYEDAYDIFYQSLNSIKDSLTKITSYRSISNILANPSFSEFDSIKSREYRKRDIELIKSSFFGETQTEYLSRSFELWALDEYSLLKNKKLGNNLIDSAKFYVTKMPDISFNKKTTINRLTEIYNYYNDILIVNNLVGEYRFYSNDGKKGRAYISRNANGININIDQLDKGELIAKLNGNGSYINIEEIRFDVGIINVRANNSGGTLKLKGYKGRSLNGYLYEFGKTPVKYYLTKKAD